MREAPGNATTLPFIDLKARSRRDALRRSRADPERVRDRIFRVTSSRPKTKRQPTPYETKGGGFGLDGPLEWVPAAAPRLGHRLAGTLRLAASRCKAAFCVGPDAHDGQNRDRTLSPRR